MKHFLENKSKWLLATGCWTLALAWPILAFYLLIHINIFGSLISNLNKSVPLFTYLSPFLFLIYFTGISIWVLSKLPYERKAKKQNMAAFIILMIVVFALLSYPVAHHG